MSLTTRRAEGTPRLLLVAVVLVAAFCVLPLAYVFLDTLSLGWSAAYELIVRPKVGRLLTTTVALTVFGVLTSAVLGTALALLVARTTLPGRAVWNVLLAAPLAVPAFVTSYGWVSLTPQVASFPGALLVLTLAYYPLVYLPVVATLSGLDPALEETAQALGLSQAKVFLRVVLPQLRPALLGGGLLVGLHLLSEYGALQLLRVETFTIAIFDSYQSSFDGPSSSTLAAVLLVLCGVLLTVELRARGLHRYARVGSGAAREQQRQRLGRGRVPSQLGVAAVVALALGVPAYSLGRWLVVGGSTRFPAADLLGTTVTSLGLGALAALATTLCALPVALLSVRYRNPLTSALERTSYLSNALPGIVVALALVSVSLRFVSPTYQTTGLLVAAYVLLFLPRSVISLRAGLAQAPVELDDVAHGLGLGTLATLRRVTLPLIARGMGVGAALVFLGTVTELTATLLLAPLGTATLATEFWAQSSQVQYGAAAPYAVLMVLVSVPATLLLSRSPSRHAQSAALLR